MKNKLMLRLCLMMTVVLSTYSCRQDLLPERETYNNTSAFQLTSKRISLNDSKHKSKLLSELEKAETEFKKIRINAFGKTVNYGNGVSIDTDDVIYIENATGFHSYTFNIKHDNAPADAPVENLVLSPLTDGTYRELLLSYNLSPQEKQMLENNISVDVGGKIIITELAQGTYNNGGTLAKSNMSCEWVEEIVWQSCSEGKHDGSNAGACYFNTHPSEGTPPKSFVMVTQRCTALPVDTSLGENGDGGGSGPQNGLGGLSGSNPPEVPTIPNVPIKGGTPCQKIKAIANNPALKSKIDSLKAFSLTAEENEKGYQQDKAGNITPALVNGAHYVEFIVDQNSVGGIHCHTLNGTHMFSPKDILTFLSVARVQNQTLPVGSTADYTGNAFIGMISQSSNYFITFNGGSGDLPPPMTDAEEEAFEEKMNKTYKRIIKDLLKAEGKTKGDTLSQQGLQKLFFDLIKEMGLEGKINLVQQDGSNTSTIQQNADGTIKAPIPC